MFACFTRTVRTAAGPKSPILSSAKAFACLGTNLTVRIRIESSCSTHSKYLLHRQEPGPALLPAGHFWRNQTDITAECRRSKFGIARTHTSCKHGQKFDLNHPFNNAASDKRLSPASAHPVPVNGNRGIGLRNLTEPFRVFEVGNETIAPVQTL